MSAELWDLFVEDAGELVRRLRAGANAADAQALAVGALAMGVVEVGLLAGALARALEAGDDAARVAPAIAALEAAVAALASPDASGARVDAAPLVAAREALEAPAAHVETTGGVWTPAVPDDMLELFFEEAHERLEGLAQKLIALEGRPDSPELVRDYDKRWSSLDFVALSDLWERDDPEATLRKVQEIASANLWLKYRWRWR